MEWNAQVPRSSRCTRGANCDGREPSDYAAEAPHNQAYVEYYREMGLARPQAFYDMTNAVSNAEAR